MEQVLAATYSPGSLKRVLSVTGYGLITSALFRADSDPRAMRRRFERFAHTSRERVGQKFRGVAFEDHRVEELRMESVSAVKSPERAILYLHGGAYVFGSMASYRARTVRTSYRCNAEVFVPEYRLAPEHPFPAALDDAIAAFEYVRRARPDVPLFLAGDSAGGGLVLALLHMIRARGLAMPDGAIALSPWTDLANTGASVKTNDGRDVWLTQRHLDLWARYYVGGADRCDPRISPLYADPTGFPPLLFVVGESEVLLDDTRRVAARARACGVAVTTLIGREMQHDFPLTLPWLDESQQAWRAMRSFVEGHPFTPTRTDHSSTRAARRGTR